MPTKKLFVANFPDCVEEDDVRRLFEEDGGVYHIRIRKNVETGKLMWGVVEMQDERDADRAVRRLDGYWWHHRRLKVNEFQPRRD